MHPDALRDDVNAIDETGHGISIRLQAAIDGLLWTPLDDVVCEAPHAQAKRAKAPASAAKWTWIASSLRLPQHLEDVEYLRNITGTRVDAAWSSFATVTQPPRKALVFPKMKRCLLDRRLYRIEHLRGFNVEGLGVDAGGVDDDQRPRNVPALEDRDEHRGDDDDATGRRGDPAPHGDVPDALLGSADTEVPAAMAPIASAERAPNHENRAEEIVLIRQFLAAALRRYEYITLPVVGEEGDVEHQPFQLLDFERRNLIVRAFVADDEQVPMAYAATLQPMNKWMARYARDEQADLVSMDVFSLADPVKADVIAAFGSRREGVKQVMTWTARMSDVDGCVELTEPVSLADRPMDLMSLQCPVLALLDKLSSLAWTGYSDGFVHDVESEDHKFDVRAPASRRSYFQCLVHLDSLKEKGVQSFSSSGTAAFFNTLLRSKGPVRVGLSADDYRRILAVEAGDTLRAAALDRKIAARAIRPSPLYIHHHQRRQNQWRTVLGRTTSRSSVAQETAMLMMCPTRLRCWRTAMWPTLSSLIWPLGSQSRSWV